MEEFFCDTCKDYCKLSFEDGDYFCSRCGLVAQNYMDLSEGKPDSVGSANYSDLTKKHVYALTNSSQHSMKDFSGKRIGKAALAQLK